MSQLTLKVALDKSIIIKDVYQWLVIIFWSLLFLVLSVNKVVKGIL